MKSRFVFSRQMLLSGLLAATLLGGALPIQQASADTSWGEILKPLVQNVIVPGASAGMKKLVQKMEKAKGVTPDAAISSPEVITIDPSASGSDVTLPTPDAPSDDSTVTIPDVSQDVPAPPTPAP